MNSNTITEWKQVIEAVHYRPAVSIIMPFEPKMGSRATLNYELKIAADNVERDLRQNYPDDIREMMMQKLRTLIRNMNFNTHKKSVAIYVSPVFEKVLYLDIAVEQKIIIDESFEIRDLVYSKKQLHKYLVLLLSSKQSRLYLGNTESFVTLMSVGAPDASANEHEPPERVANFSDPDEWKETRMEKFLQHIDNSLGIILKAYNLPLFIAGTERITGHFKKLTKHGASIIEHIHGNYEDAGMDELKQVLLPCINDWKKVIRKNILNQLADAADKKKLAFGMQHVWREAMNQKGRLLVVEKNYMYAAEHGVSEGMIQELAEPYNKFSYIKDAVDDVIEKVLENGGDVEFVDEGELKAYRQIALVQYY